jgi:hypothetical protein
VGWESEILIGRGGIKTRVLEDVSNGLPSWPGVAVLRILGSESFASDPELGHVIRRVPNRRVGPMEPVPGKRQV